MFTENNIICSVCASYALKNPYQFELEYIRATAIIIFYTQMTAFFFYKSDDPHSVVLLFTTKK